MTKPSVNWKEDMKWEDCIFLSAESMNSWFNDVFPWLAKYKAGELVPVGREKFLEIRPFDGLAKECVYAYGFPTIFKKRASLATCYGSQNGVVFFDGTVNIPILRSNSETWMSLTPMEIFSQRGGLKKARGSVLIGGLGMGWLTLRVLQRKQVAKVTVIESDPDVALFFGEPLKEAFGNRLEIIIGDVYNHNPNLYDSVLYDIWARYWDCAYDDRFLLVAGCHKNCWGWGRGWRNKTLKIENLHRTYGGEKLKDFIGVMGFQLPSALGGV